MENQQVTNRVGIYTQTSVGATATGEGLALQRDESPVAQQEVNQPATSVSQSCIGTTRAGRPRQRIQWTNDMNEYVLRCYYTTTKCENPENMLIYRREMFNMFVARYSNLESRVNENNLARRKDVILQKDYVEINRRQRIKAEVQAEIEAIIPLLHRASNETPTSILNAPEASSETSTELSPPASNTPLIRVHQTPLETLTHTTSELSTVQATTETQRIRNIFTLSLVEFEGIDPPLRPRIPKLHESKKLEVVLDIINSSILPQFLEDETTMERVNDLLFVSAISAARALGREPKSISENPRQCQNGTKVPKWNKRLRNKIANLRRDIGRLMSFRDGSISSRNSRHISRLIAPLRPVNLSRDEMNEIIDRKAQKLAALAKRLKRYEKCSNRKSENALFSSDQKAFYRKCASTPATGSENIYPAFNVTENFWSNIWSIPKQHNVNAEWIADEIEQFKNTVSMPYQSVSREEVYKAISETSNWKAPGVDKLHNIWLKKLPASHEKLAKCFTDLLELKTTPPRFFTSGVTFLIPKGNPCNDPSKYRPITCLCTTYKLFTKILTNRIYEHCTINNVIPDTQKGCSRQTMGCKDQLTIDSVITSLALKKKRSISMAFIDYKKAFDSMPHNYLLKMLEVYKIDQTIVNCLKVIMGGWNTRLSQNGRLSEVVPIRSGIFQGDALSPLWFCIGLNPLSRILAKIKSGFVIKTETFDYSFNHLLYMDDLKLYAKNREKLHRMIEVVKSFSTDIQMEFGMEKCKMVHLVKGKVDTNEDGFPINQEQVVKDLQHGESYKYLGFLQLRGINHSVIKCSLTAQFKSRINTILKSNLSGGNKCKGINTWAIPLLTYSFGIIKWSSTDLTNLDTLIRTSFTSHNSLHPRSAIERMSLPRKIGGRGIVNIANLHHQQCLNIRQYLLNNSSLLVKTICLADDNFTPLNLSLTNFPVPDNFKTRDELITSWKVKPLHGCHPNELSQDHINQEASNLWLMQGHLFSETEGFVISIQDKVIATRNYRKYILRESVDDRCRRCGENGETVEHITSGCSTLASHEYLNRHNNVAKLIHQQLALKCGLIQNQTPYYKYQPSAVLENSEFKLYWDRTITTDQHIPANRPDIVLFHKSEKRIDIFDVAVTLNRNLQTTHSMKISKYSSLAIELRTMYNMERVDVTPIVISTTGLIPKNLCINLKKHNMEWLLAQIQKSVLLDTCNIVRKFLQL